MSHTLLLVGHGRMPGLPAVKYRDLYSLPPQTCHCPEPLKDVIEMQVKQLCRVSHPQAPAVTDVTQTLDIASIKSPRTRADVPWIALSGILQAM